MTLNSNHHHLFCVSLQRWKLSSDCPRYQPGPRYQPCPRCQPCPRYQPCLRYQPGPKYQPGPMYQPGPRYQPGPSYQPGPRYQAKRGIGMPLAQTCGDLDSGAPPFKQKHGVSENLWTAEGFQTATNQK